MACAVAEAPHPRLILACRAAGLLLLGIATHKILATIAMYAGATSMALLRFPEPTAPSRLITWQDVLNLSSVFQLLVTCGPSLLAFAAGTYLLLRDRAALFRSSFRSNS